MNKFRSYIAVFLLFMLGRVLLPEQAILTLHGHEHTSHEHHQTPEGQPHIDVKHTHCQVDHLFDAPFQPSVQHFRFEKPLVFSVQNSVYHTVWKFTFPNNACLRGPPVLS